MENISFLFPLRPQMEAEIGQETMRGEQVWETVQADGLELTSPTQHQ